MSEPQAIEPCVSQPLVPPCRHLRSNALYVFSEGRDDTGTDDYDASASWCLQTMKAVGPDDDLAGGRECRDASRSCYEPL